MTSRLFHLMRKPIQSFISRGAMACNYSDFSGAGIANQSGSTNIYRDKLHLPFKASLISGSKVIVTLMTDEQFSATYDMIQEAARQGKGIGINEFESMDEFRYDFREGQNFAITMETTGEHIASFLLSTCFYVRGVKAVDPLIITKPEYRDQGVGYLSRDVIECFAKRLGYVAIYTDCFSNSLAMKHMMDESEGYEIVGELPASGLMPDGTVVSSLIYYKDLRTSFNRYDDNEK